MQDDRLGVLIVEGGADPLAGLPEPVGVTGLLLGGGLNGLLPRALADPRWALVRSCPSPAPAPFSSSHGAGCACCQGRAPLALLLSELFQQRARSQLPFFRSLLLLVAAGEVEATREVLLGDRLVAGRYRVLPGPETSAQRK